MKENITRRNFLQTSAVVGVGSALSFPALSSASFYQKNQQEGLEIHVFSKHLQFLNYKGSAEAAAEIGFNGLDLTVRPKGHVLPERVADDLPKAADALKSAGFQPKLMTTAITNAEELSSRQVLETAANLGIKFYRMGSYRFDEELPIPYHIEKCSEQVAALSKLNEKLKITGGYQNHAGLRVGAAIWEIWQLLGKVKNDYMGCQYDIRHATVEGGLAWPTGLKLIEPKIKTIVLKDFLWKNINGTWKVVNVPFGEGMVDFDAYFKMLKRLKIKVPVSMHYEYDLGGAEHGKSDLSIDRKEVFKAMKRDLTRAREAWEKA